MRRRAARKRRKRTGRPQRRLQPRLARERKPSVQRESQARRDTLDTASFNLLARTVRSCRLRLTAPKALRIRTQGGDANRGEADADCETEEGIGPQPLRNAGDMRLPGQPY